MTQWAHFMAISAPASIGRGRRRNGPETQCLQLLRVGVDTGNIYREVGVSGSTGTNTRNGWRLLNSHMDAGDVLVVASVDLIGRHWMGAIGTIRDLRNRQVRLRSLTPAEEAWTRYLDADPDTPEAMVTSWLAFLPGRHNTNLAASNAAPRPAWRGPGPLGRPSDRLVR